MLAIGKMCKNLRDGPIRRVLSSRKDLESRFDLNLVDPFSSRRTGNKVGFAHSASGIVKKQK